eukprot:2764285-Pyramimonas_sp.AAC.1
MRTAAQPPSAQLCYDRQIILALNAIDHTHASGTAIRSVASYYYQTSSVQHFQVSRSAAWKSIRNGSLCGEHQQAHRTKLSSRPSSSMTAFGNKQQTCSSPLRTTPTSSSHQGRRQSSPTPRSTAQNVTQQSPQVTISSVMEREAPPSDSIAQVWGTNP